MTNLITKAQRDAIGIRVLEQAICWSVLTLEGVVKNPQRKRESATYPFITWVTTNLSRQVTTNTVATYFSFTVDLPFNYHLSANDALELIPYIGKFFEGDPLPWAGQTSAQLTTAGLPQTEWTGNLIAEPEIINTVEKFLLWCCIQKEVDLYDPWPATIPDLKIDIFPESPKGQIVRVSGLIPFDYAIYRQNQNLLFSLHPIGTPFPAGSGGSSSVAWSAITGKPNFVSVLGDLDDVNLNTTLEGATQGLVYDPIDEIWLRGTIVSEAGQGIHHIELTSTSGLVKTYTIWGDIGETINLGTFTLTDGANGQNGQSGQDGQDGQGIHHIELTSTSGLVKTYTIWGNVAETVNLGTFTLTDGANGQDGADGADGATGSVEAATVLKLNHTVSPTEEAGKILLYGKADNKLYFKLPDGTELSFLLSSQLLNGRLNPTLIPNGFTESKYFNLTTLTDGGNITWNLESNQVAKVTLEGNRTLNNPLNQVAGATYILMVQQDGIGSRSLSFGTAYKFSGGTSPTLSTGAGKVDILSFISDGVNMYGSFAGGF